MLYHSRIFIFILLGHVHIPLGRIRNDAAMSEEATHNVYVDGFLICGVKVPDGSTQEDRNLIRSSLAVEYKIPRHYIRLMKIMAKSIMFCAVMGSAMPVYAEPYPMERAVTIPVTADVIGAEEVINCAMTADGLPEGCEIVEPASGEEE